MAFDVSSIGNPVKPYADWANGAKVGELAGQKGRQVADLDKITDGLARVCHFKSVGAARQAAVDGFRGALRAAVGATIADAAWKAAGGGDVKGLTAELVRKTVGLTKRLDDQVRPQFMPSGAARRLNNLSSADVSTAVTGGRNANTVSDQCKVAVAMAKADALLCMSPGSQKACETLITKLRTARAELATAKGVDRAQIDAQCKALQAKMKEVDALKSNLPGGEKSLEGLAKLWKESLGVACGKMLASVPPEKREELQKKLGDLMAKCDDREMLALLKSEKKDIVDKLQGMVKSCVRSAVGFFLPKDVKKALADVCKNSHIEVLNKRGWAKIENKFDGFVGGSKFHMESDIVPGRHIDDSIGKQYENGVNGYNCQTKNTANAVNLATSRLQIDGRTVFSGVRHGVHNAKDVPGMTKQNANIQRAQQTVTAAFKTYLETHAKEVAAMERSGKPIPLNLTSLSLLTPVTIDVTRCKEKGMFKNQLAAWNAINELKEPLEVTVNNRTYKVKPNVLTFNYGVNQGALTTTAGWGVTGGLNSKSLETLLNRAKDFSGHCRDSATKAAVDTLAEQVRYIADHKLERREGNEAIRTGGEAYKMPARLAVLSYLMGDVPVWNCKSGKDRTGMLDVEAKFLATLIDRGQPIPKPGAKLTEEQSQLLQTIMLKSGNHEMQEYNTGIAGYKLKGVDSIYRRAGADGATKATLMGGSSYIGS